MLKMKNLALPMVLAAATLSACSPNERISSTQVEYKEGAADMAAPAPPPPPREQIADASMQKPESGENPTALSYLAYRYNYAFALPAKSVANTAEQHAETCRNAGPSVCQVLSSSASTENESYVSAHLQFRAEPKWLETFTQSVIQSVETAEGDLVNKSVSAEDLTRQLLDTDARLNAQKTLRSRLESLLETKNADLKDLLALEREFARVQGDIESTTSTLNVLRKRVSMSVVDMRYNSKQVAVSRSAFAPISRAFKGFAQTFSYSVAAVIEFVAAVLPWLFLIIPTIWLLRKFWRRRKSTRTAKS